MSWIAVGIGAAVGAGAGAIYGSQKGGDEVWKDALMGGALGAVGGAGVGALGAGAGAAGAGATEAGAIGAAGTAEAGSGLALGGAGLETGGAMGGAGIVGGTEAGALGTAGAGQMAAIPGVTPAAGVFESSVPATLQMSVPGATVAGPGITSTAGTAGTAGTGGGTAGGTGLGGWWGGLSSLEKAGVVGAGTVGLGALINQDNKKYGVPEEEQYNGPLSQFHYSPSTYTPTYATPNVYKPRYAEGGITGLATGGDPMNPIQNPIYPQSQQQQTNFATSTQYPNSISSAMAADYDTRTNPMTGAELPMGMADGGIASLGSYSDGGQLLRGPGDGVSDSIPASIGRRQPARLADGEFVVPARAVSELGNGSTDAGAKQLYSMLDRIESKRKKGKGLAYQASPKKMMPA